MSQSKTELIDKEGKLPFKLVPGKYGNEYRILEIPRDRIKEEALDTTPALALDIIQRLEAENSLGNT